MLWKVEWKSAEAAGDRPGMVVAGLIVAAMLACLCGCAQPAPTEGGAAEQAPGSFSAHFGGQMTSAVGMAKQ